MAQDPRLEVGLVCPPHWGSQKFEVSPTSAHPQEEGFPCFQIPIHLNGHNHFHWYHRSLRKVMDDFKPDIVNIEEEHYSFVTYQVCRLAKQLGAKTLFYTWQNIEKKYPPPFSWMEQRVFRQASAAVVGNEEAGVILRHKGFQGLIECLPQMGVNDDLFPKTLASAGEKDAQKRSLGLDEKIPWILYCGRLVPEKGVSLIVEALRSLSSQKLSCGLALLGDGPERGAIEEAAKQLPPQIPVKMIPFVPSHKVVPWMVAADILCLPSITRPNWKEQFGRVLVEAMACSTVCVGSDSGEIPHVIADAGLVFAENNPESLALSLQKLICDQNLREKFKQIGFGRVQTKYTHRVIAQKLCDLLFRVRHS